MEDVITHKKLQNNSAHSPALGFASHQLPVIILQ